MYLQLRNASLSNFVRNTPTIKNYDVKYFCIVFVTNKLKLLLVLLFLYCTKDVNFLFKKKLKKYPKDMSLIIQFIDILQLLFIRYNTETKDRTHDFTTWCF